MPVLLAPHRSVLHAVPVLLAPHRSVLHAVAVPAGAPARPGGVPLPPAQPQPPLRGPGHGGRPPADAAQPRLRWTRCHGRDTQHNTHYTH